MTARAPRPAGPATSRRWTTRAWPRTARVLAGEFHERAGVDAAGRLLRGAALPTAIIAANDLVAVGLIDRLEQDGVRIPEDVSVIGYDNTFIAGLAHVQLTTINQPRREMGVEAFALLLERTDGPQRARDARPRAHAGGPLDHRPAAAMNAARPTTRARRPLASPLAPRAPSRRLAPPRRLAPSRGPAGWRPSRPSPSWRSSRPGAAHPRRPSHCASRCPAAPSPPPSPWGRGACSPSRMCSTARGSSGSMAGRRGSCAWTGGWISPSSRCPASTPRPYAPRPRKRGRGAGPARR